MNTLATTKDSTVPAEAWYFLAGTTVLLLLVILAILYLEKFACFKICDGATCFDVASTDAGDEDLEDDDKPIPVKVM